MPTITAENVYEISHRLLCAGGALDGHAITVARHLVDANLAGHDSHGFIRIIQYLKNIDDGHIDPEAQPELVNDGKGTAKVNGNSTFGQVVATFATQLAIDKAREFGISMVNMFNLAHTGRIGTYSEMVAREGMVAIVCTGFAGGPKNPVAPFGGREARLGTNPISMGFPSSSGAPILLDFATSMAAEGKLRVYRARGQKLPDEWVLTKDGLPSKDPNDYYEGGSILPFGGLHGGHKGYALSFMVALLGGAMGEISELDVGHDSQINGSSIIVVNVEALSPVEYVRAQVGNLVKYMKDTPAMEGSSGVLYPGEIEAKTREDRLANGIEVEQATWDQIVDLIKKHNLKEVLAHLN